MKRKRIDQLVNGDYFEHWEDGLVCFERRDDVHIYYAIFPQSRPEPAESGYSPATEVMTFTLAEVDESIDRW